LTIRNAMIVCLYQRGESPRKFCTKADRIDCATIFSSSAKSAFLLPFSASAALHLVRRAFCNRVEHEPRKAGLWGLRQLCWMVETAQMDAAVEEC